DHNRLVALLGELFEDGKRQLRLAARRLADDKHPRAINRNSNFMAGQVGSHEDATSRPTIKMFQIVVQNLIDELSDTRAAGAARNDVDLLLHNVERIVDRRRGLAKF